MCFSSPKVNKTPTPPEPEPVKRVESEVTKARSDAKTAAAQRFGIAGTNVTKGSLAAEEANVKKNKLGGTA